MASLLLTFSLAHLIASYWTYFSMGTAGGNGLALVYVVWPIAMVSFVLTALLCHRWCARHSTGWRLELLSTFLALAIVYGALFSIEVVRTRDYPTESGNPVNPMAFLRNYVSRRD